MLKIYPTRYIVKISLMGYIVAPRLINGECYEISGQNDAATGNDPTGV